MVILITAPFEDYQMMKFKKKKYNLCKSRTMIKFTISTSQKLQQNDVMLKFT